MPQLIIAFATCAGQGWQDAMKNLADASLPNLHKLLRGMKLNHADSGETASLSTPHERALARALGLQAPDGLIPWAALKAGDSSGKGWAFITPCHWAMGREHATLTDPAGLGVTEGESQALMAAMQPYFATEGITLHPASPGRWLAEGELFRHLPTASLDRVLGRNVDPWLPGGKQTDAGARQLRRLQNEMQMLLYTHALNDERAARRQQSINSLWFSGTGASVQAPAEHAKAPVVNRSLASAVFADDWQAYGAAWAELDKGIIADLLARQQSGDAVQLSLCGEAHAQTFETAKRGLFGKISSLLARQPSFDVLKQL